jgi:hypothetical protein
MRTATFLLALVFIALAPADARGDGLPVPLDSGPGALVEPQRGTRLSTVSTRRETVVVRTEQDGGAIADSVVVRGVFTIPAVALDGTAAGLSHDGSTLVLIRPRARFPRAQTTLAILDARRLRVRRTVSLRGDFSFDALSLDGATVYLIQYIDRRDPTRYLVRALDRRTGRLRPGAIVDPNESADEMRGFPLTRATSQDGRWEYTLYDGMGEHPFVHALDTVAARAVCIDLPHAVAATDMTSLRLDVTPGGDRLNVVGPRGAVAVVDTASFDASEPARRKGETARGDGGGGPSVAWTVASAGTLILMIALGARARRRARMPA